MDILCCVLSVVWCYVMLCCVRSCCVMLRYVHTPQMGWEDSERTHLLIPVVKPWRIPMV